MKLTTQNEAHFELHNNQNDPDSKDKPITSEDYDYLVGLNLGMLGMLAKQCGISEIELHSLLNGDLPYEEEERLWARMEKAT